MRLIDADLLKGDLSKFYEGIVTARELIDNQPTVEQQKVILCKDCKHWREHEFSTTCERNIGNGFPSDYYCAFGEAKDGEQE